ncbi:MAG TPA: aminoacyl-tRNA hydrolase [Longimicrobiales bacterium]
MKVVCGLGNPGAEYEATRHNVGWWLVDRLAEAWRLGPFRREGRARIASGRFGDEVVRLVKPLTYMNRSGAAVAPLRTVPDFDVARDLLVVVDDVALDPGRIRLRARGSAGGHNGLRSIEAALRTREYARLRIGVGAPPAGAELADWVLDRPTREEEERILALMPDLTEAVRVWIEEGIEAAMNRFNR